MTRHAAAYDGEADPDWELTGTSVELHLRLWNRAEAQDSPETGDWRRLTAVTWG